MIIKFTPEGQDAREWTFEPRKVKQSVAEMIEKRAGCGFNEWVLAVRQGSAKAWKVLVWHLLCRETGYALRWEDVPDFAMGDIEIGLDLAEWLQTRETAADSPALTDDEREAALAQIDGEIEKLAGKAVIEGKALSRSDDTATGSPSPHTCT